MPQFLLPETKAEYERLCREEVARVEAIKAAFAEKAWIFVEEIPVLEKLATDLEEQRKKETLGAKKELLSRACDRAINRISDLQHRAAAYTNETLWKVVVRFKLPEDYDPMRIDLSAGMANIERDLVYFSKFPYIAAWAEKMARKAEQEKIFRDGKEISRELTPQGMDGKRQMRELIQYPGGEGYFVCQLSLAPDESGHMWAPNGIDWMTDSLKQMSDAELENIVEFSQTQS